MIRVVLAEDHHLVRQGASRLLEDAGDIQVVGEADNGRDAIKQCQLLRPDVLVLDIAMPHMTGLQVLAELNAMELAPHVVILSMHGELDTVRQALRTGVLGYVSKQSVASELLAAVRAASGGSLYLSADVSQTIKQDLCGERPPSLLDLLSPRERLVVERVVQGYAIKEIADDLHTSVKTVEKQRRDAMRKLEVDNVASLVRVCLELGLDIGKRAGIGHV